jgi:hypothetical protein
MPGRLTLRSWEAPCRSSWQAPATASYRLGAPACSTAIGRRSGPDIRPAPERHTASPTAGGARPSGRVPGTLSRTWYPGPHPRPDAHSARSPARRACPEERARWCPGPHPRAPHGRPTPTPFFLAGDDGSMPDRLRAWSWQVVWAGRARSPPNTARQLHRHARRDRPGV